MIATGAETAYSKEQEFLFVSLFKYRLHWSEDLLKIGNCFPLCDQFYSIYLILISI